MIIKRKLSEVPVMDTAHNVDARNIYNTKDAMITVITLSPVAGNDNSPVG